MDDLWFEIVNSNWRGYSQRNLQQDHLLESHWIEQVLHENNIQIELPLSVEAIEAIQSLRTTMQNMVEFFSTGSSPSEEDIATLNAYLAMTPTIIQLKFKDTQYLLKQVPLQSDWHWFLREVAASFVTFITSHNPTWIKRCGNPNCRWTYYDESHQKNRRWCNDRCANLMRVRLFRETHRRGELRNL